MEVGAVKQDFNTEVILLKKKLNQAKIQIIHKLTRKAKQLTEKKAPEQLQEKLKRKAESAVKEVLIIKKIKPKDLAKFIVTHKGELNTFLNKPQVDEDKACARLLLHKALQEKYKFIRGRFSNVPIKDLFMSRIERRKMKKEAKEKQKNKKKAKNDKVVNSEGDWNVEDVVMADDSKLSGGGEDNDVSGDEGSEQEMSGDEIDDNEVSGDENDDNEVSGDENDDNEVSGDDDDEQSEEDNVQDGDSEAKDVKEHNGSEVREDQSDAAVESSDDEVKEEVSKVLKATPKFKQAVGDAKSKAEKPVAVNTKAKEVIQTKKPPKEIIKKNPVKKQKELNKTKHFNEKIQQKKFKKNSDAPIVENKIADPFFITSSGGNYMSVVEPKGPDEIKEDHFKGNRKLRRAVQFGLVPKSKLRQNNHKNEDRFNKQNSYDRGNNFKGKFNDRQNDRRNFNDRKPFNNDRSFNNRNDRKPFNNDRGFNNRNDRKPFNNDRGFNNRNDRKPFNNDNRGFNNRNDKNNDEKPEKLHPSWEAKKKKSGILPFEGKKIVFDES